MCYGIPNPFWQIWSWHIFLPWQVPQDLSLQDWDEGTLDDKRQYTSEIDVYQIGVMLLKFLEVSAASRAFADKLKSMSVSAADAAEDTSSCVSKDFDKNQSPRLQLQRLKNCLDQKRSRA
ncbi:TPA: hypothetical protein ACH3X2_010971 [Trebouxia sp. C0005]